MQREMYLTPEAIVCGDWDKSSIISRGYVCAMDAAVDNRTNWITQTLFFGGFKYIFTGKYTDQIANEIGIKRGIFYRQNIEKILTYFVKQCATYEQESGVISITNRQAFTLYYLMHGGNPRSTPCYYPYFSVNENLENLNLIPQRVRECLKIGESLYHAIIIDEVTAINDFVKESGELLFAVGTLSTGFTGAILRAGNRDDLMDKALAAKSAILTRGGSYYEPNTYKDCRAIWNHMMPGMLSSASFQCEVAI